MPYPPPPTIDPRTLINPPASLTSQSHATQKGRKQQQQQQQLASFPYFRVMSERGTRDEDSSSPFPPNTNDRADDDSQSYQIVDDDPPRQVLAQHQQEVRPPHHNHNLGGTRSAASYSPIGASAADEEANEGSGSMTGGFVTVGRGRGGDGGGDRGDALLNDALPHNRKPAAVPTFKTGGYGGGTGSAHPWKSPGGSVLGGGPPRRGGTGAGGGASGLAELDLHGYQKEAAIRELTRFLERHADSWVHVITGSGTNSPNGPVLRTAVEKLLKRRDMEYKKTSPGSFLVNAASGIVLYEPMQPVDTKVLLAPRPSAGASTTTTTTPGSSSSATTASFTASMTTMATMSAASLPEGAAAAAAAAAAPDNSSAPSGAPNPGFVFFKVPSPPPTQPVPAPAGGVWDSVPAPSSSSLRAGGGSAAPLAAPDDRRSPPLPTSVSADLSASADAVSTLSSRRSSQISSSGPSPQQPQPSPQHPRRVSFRGAEHEDNDDDDDVDEPPPLPDRTPVAPITTPAIVEAEVVAAATTTTNHPRLPRRRVIPYATAVPVVEGATDPSSSEDCDGDEHDLDDAAGAEGLHRRDMDDDDAFDNDPVARRLQEEIRQLETARRSSLAEAQRAKEEKARLDEQLKKALRLSQLEESKRRAEEKQRLEEEMRKAIELSRAEAEREEHLLRQVLELSQKEASEPSSLLATGADGDAAGSSSKESDDEQVYKRALERSLEETSAEDLYKQVVERSLKETSAEDEMQLALERSKQETAVVDDEEDRLVQEALALSLKESYR